MVASGANTISNMKKILGWAYNVRVSVALLMVSIVVMSIWDMSEFGLWGFLVAPAIGMSFITGFTGLMLGWDAEMCRLFNEQKDNDEEDGEE